MIWQQQVGEGARVARFNNEGENAEPGCAVRDFFQARAV